jgi:hypothetical protein
MEHVSEREIYGGALRIQLQRQILRGGRHGNGEKYKCPEDTARTTSAKSLSVFFHGLCCQ